MHGGLVTLSAHTGEKLRQVQLSLVTDGEIKQFLFGKKCGESDRRRSVKMMSWQPVDRA